MFCAGKYVCLIQSVSSVLLLFSLPFFLRQNSTLVFVVFLSLWFSPCCFVVPALFGCPFFLLSMSRTGGHVSLVLGVLPALLLCLPF